MKKSIILFLSFLLFLHSGIISTFFSFKQELLRKEIQENLEQKLSFTLKIPKSEFNSYSISNHEIVYHNELHDIVSFETNNQFIFLKIIEDKIEKEYIRKTADYKSKTNSKSKSTFFKTKLIFPLETISNIEISFFKKDSHTILNYYFVTHLKPLYQDNCAPPPEFNSDIT